jgi:hypothetical protein
LFELHQQFDIRGVSFDEFVDFLFEHEIPPEPDRKGRRSQRWYDTADIEFDARQLVEHYTRLFTEPRFLLGQYSREKLEQAFWAIMGGLLDCSVAEAIWNEEVDFWKRADCVRSMYFLYEKLFAVDPLDTSSHMWWDSLAYDWHCGNRNRSRGGEDLLMQDVIFETLERILALAYLSCQGAALHGLGHLHHPKTTELIDAYLNRNPSIDQEMKGYAKAAARFEVL